MSETNNFFWLLMNEDLQLGCCTFVIDPHRNLSTYVSKPFPRDSIHLRFQKQPQESKKLGAHKISEIILPIMVNLLDLWQ